MKRFDAGARYFEADFWIRKEKDLYAIGVTDFAQEFFRDLTNIYLPEPGDFFSKGDVFCTVESAKSTFELNLPVQGIIAEINTKLKADASKINKFPYRSWIVKLEKVPERDWESLSSVTEYRDFLRAMFNKGN